MTPRKGSKGVQKFRKDHPKDEKGQRGIGRRQYPDIQGVGSHIEGNKYKEGMRRD